MHANYQLLCAGDNDRFRGYAEVFVEFDADICGPVKCLQLFASLDMLPKYFSITRKTDRAGWRVEFEIAPEAGSRTDLNLNRMRRVLSKIATLTHVEEVGASYG